MDENEEAEALATELNRLVDERDELMRRALEMGPHIRELIEKIRREEPTRGG